MVISCAEARSGSCGLDQGSASLFPRLHSNGVRSVQVFVGLVGMRFTKVSVVPQPPEPSDLGGDVAIFTRVRRDRTSIAFVQLRRDVTIDVFRETQLRRRGGALPFNPRPLGRFDRYSRIDLTAS